MFPRSRLTRLLLRLHMGLALSSELILFAELVPWVRPALFSELIVTLDEATQV